MLAMARFLKEGMGLADEYRITVFFLGILE
jgi:hypothetical protein